ncbi:MGMT family protein [uncultured Campylobacter sp.]|nr:MGMT family protein [uncultured Campylobacter sp.]
MEEIPASRVASYGQIARLIGLPACSRLVGRVLSQACSTAITRATAS